MGRGAMAGTHARRGGRGVTGAPEASAAERQPAVAFTMGHVGRHTLVYGGGILLNKALAFVMLPLYTRYLTPADYGVMGLIEMTLDVIAILGGVQLAQGIYRYYHKATDQREREEVVFTALLALGMSYVVVSLAAFAAAPFLSQTVFQTGEHAGLIRLAAAGMAFQSALVVPLAYARVRDLSGLYVSVSAAKLSLAAALNVLFIAGMEMGAAGVFTSTLITNAVVGVALTVWLVRSVGLRPSGQAFRNLARYGTPLIATQFATFIATFGDRYFLQRETGPAEVGLYNLAYQFGFLLAVVGFVPFDMVWGPKRFEIAARRDRDDLLAKGFIYANLLLITTAVGIVLFVEPVLTVMSDPAFHAAADLVPVILIAYLLQSWAKCQDTGILVRERTEYITAADWIAALVAVVAFAVVIPVWHSWGAAVATVGAFAVRYALTYTFSQRLWPVAYRWGPVLRLVGLGLTVSLVAILLPDSGLAAGLAARSGLLLVYAVGVWNAGILTSAERDRLELSARRAWRWGQRRLFAWSAR